MSLEVTIHRDLRYANPHGKQLLADLYLPKQDAARLPVIVWLHGGGWRLGDRRLAPDLQRYFAQAGFAMASIEYRLSGEAIFPAAVEDVKTAVRWLRASADTYGLDPARIGLWGSSSGGHLAALAALSGPGVFESPASEYSGYSSEVQAVMDGYGPVDFLEMDAQRTAAGVVSDDPESVKLPKDLRSNSADSFESLFLGAPITTCRDLVRQANPVTYARASAPPFLIMHGLADSAVPAKQSELLYEALAAHAGNEVTLGLITGLGHGFLNRNHLDDGPKRTIELRGLTYGGADSGIFERIFRFFQQKL